MYTALKKFLRISLILQIFCYSKRHLSQFNETLLFSEFIEGQIFLPKKVVKYHKQLE